jgi:hypothetical protein
MSAAGINAEYTATCLDHACEILLGHGLSKYIVPNEDLVRNLELSADGQHLVVDASPPSKVIAERPILSILCDREARVDVPGSTHTKGTSFDLLRMLAASGGFQSMLISGPRKLDKVLRRASSLKSFGFKANGVLVSGRPPDPKSILMQHN